MFCQYNWWTCWAAKNSHVSLSFEYTKTWNEFLCYTCSRASETYEVLIAQQHYDTLMKIILDHLERSQRLLCMLCARYRVCCCVWSSGAHHAMIKKLLIRLWVPVYWKCASNCSKHIPCKHFVLFVNKFWKFSTTLLL